MSVIRSKRSDSKMEFIHTARELQIYSIKKCSNFPKRYTFYIGQPIANSATRIHEYTKIANSVYPKNAHEAQFRRDCLLRANAELNSLVSQIEVAQELFGLEPNVIKHWMDIVGKEMRLVKGVIKDDQARYKNLK